MGGDTTAVAVAQWTRDNTVILFSVRDMACHLNRRVVLPATSNTAGCCGPATSPN